MVHRPFPLWLPQSRTRHVTPCASLPPTGCGLLRAGLHLPGLQAQPKAGSGAEGAPSASGELGEVPSGQLLLKQRPHSTTGHPETSWPYIFSDTFQHRKVCNESRENHQVALRAFLACPQLYPFYSPLTWEIKAMCQHSAPSPVT